LEAITFSEIISKAESLTGLAADCDGSWREGLEILIDDCARVDKLTQYGLSYIRELFVSNLVNRLRLDEHIRRHPEALEAPVYRPVFILGMPRTGTTMTSYLMGSDPRRRSLLKWEAANLIPPAARGTL